MFGKAVTLCRLFQVWGYALLAGNPSFNIREKILFWAYNSEGNAVRNKAVTTEKRRRNSFIYIFYLFMYRNSKRLGILLEKNRVDLKNFL